MPMPGLDHGGKHQDASGLVGELARAWNLADKAMKRLIGVGSISAAEAAWLVRGAATIVARR